MKTHNIKVKS